MGCSLIYLRLILCLVFLGSSRDHTSRLFDLHWHHNPCFHSAIDFSSCHTVSYLHSLASERNHPGNLIQNQSLVARFGIHSMVCSIIFPLLHGGTWRSCLSAVYTQWLFASHQCSYFECSPPSLHALSNSQQIQGKHVV